MDGWILPVAASVLVVGVPLQALGIKVTRRRVQEAVRAGTLAPKMPALRPAYFPWGTWSVPEVEFAVRYWRWAAAGLGMFFAVAAALIVLSALPLPWLVITLAYGVAGAVAAVLQLRAVALGAKAGRLSPHPSGRKVP